MPPVTEVSQPLQALELANGIRIAAARLKRELKAGEVTFAAALDHPDAGSISVLDMLASQPRWAKIRARHVLNTSVMWAREVPVIIGENRRVRELTIRQREVLLEVVHLENRVRRGAVRRAA